MTGTGTGTGWDRDWDRDWGCDWDRDWDRDWGCDRDTPTSYTGAPLRGRSLLVAAVAGGGRSHGSAAVPTALWDGYRAIKHAARPVPAVTGLKTRHPCRPVMLGWLDAVGGAMHDSASGGNRVEVKRIPESGSPAADRVCRSLVSMSSSNSHSGLRPLSGLSLYQLSAGGRFQRQASPPFTGPVLR